MNHIHNTYLEPLAVIGHGQLGSTLFNRLNKICTTVYHLRHSDPIPKEVVMVFNCIPAKYQHSSINKMRSDGYKGIIVDTSQKSEIPEAELVLGKGNKKMGKNNSVFQDSDIYGYAKAFGDIGAYDIALIDRQSKTSFVYATNPLVFSKIAGLQQMMNIQPVFINDKSLIMQPGA